MIVTFRVPYKSAFKLNYNTNTLHYEIPNQGLWHSLATIGIKIWGQIARDVTKLKLKFDNVRTSNVFNRFKI